MKPGQEVFGRNVHQFEFVGHFEHPVRDGLPHDDPGDLSDHIIQAFNVLDVERRPDIDPGDQKVFHILPTLLMPAPLGIGVGQFIHKDQLGTADKGRIDIKTTERNGPVIAVRGVTDNDSVMFITAGGLLTRVAARGISQIGRNTQGVRLVKLNEGDRVIATARIADGSADEVAEAPPPETPAE